ncbi:MAG TPA: sensor domain-containing diguanylate cyclase [Spirochaetota bacterium]|nr:sensor domain-containing diguanylate cyclase [Spirochaetota bacterium]HOL57132.1 sensor domain-containing diguanylate cyclase [Spirochaetota bacterium]
MSKKKKEKKNKEKDCYLNCSKVEIQRLNILKLKKRVKKNEEIIDKLKTLIEVNSIIASSLDRKKTLKSILDQTKYLMKCSKSSILLIDPETNKLKFEVLTNEEDKAILSDIRLSMGEGIAGTVWENGQSILIKDATKDVRFSKKADEKTKDTTRSLIAVPLVVNGEIIGVMEAMNKLDGTSFTNFDLEIFKTLAMQAAIGIENANLYEQAVTDGLTRLFLHRYFDKMIEVEYNKAKSFNKPLSLIIFDIDHFKKINDIYGHQAGDMILKKVASVIKENCKDNYIPCRYGGEEFTVILPETEIEEALSFGWLINKEIQKLEIPYEENIIKLTISGGISNLEKNKAKDFISLIKMADTALYYSKESGRNRISVFEKEFSIKE